MNKEEIKHKLAEKGFKITPQRIAILEAIYSLNNHPSAENIIDYIKEMYPNIATGTVYKVLNVFVENNLVKKVKTENDIMRYDGILDSHHHLHDKNSDLIMDYFDENLDELLRNYFEENNIKNFSIEEIMVQIKGEFK